MYDDIEGRDWRWSRVSELFKDKRRPSRAHDEPLIHQLYNFLRRYESSKKSERFVLKKEYPEIAAAVGIYERAMGPKWLLEAAVMGRVPTENIAEYLAIPAPAIRMYELIFFDVRARLEVPGWIMSNIFMPYAETGINARNCDHFWKMLAYYGNFSLVEEFTKFGELSPANSEWLEGAFKAQVMKDGFKALQLRTINQYNANEIVQQSIEILKAAGEERSRQVGIGVAHEGLSALIGSISMTIATTDDTFEHNEPRALAFRDNCGLPNKGSPLPAEVHNV